MDMSANSDRNVVVDRDVRAARVTASRSDGWSRPWGHSAQAAAPATGRGSGARRRAASAFSRARRVRSERAHAFAAIEQKRLPSRHGSPFTARPAEVDLTQRDATAVQETLAPHAWKMADSFVELAGFLELVGRSFTKFSPVVVVVKWASGCRRSWAPRSDSAATARRRTPHASFSIRAADNG